MKRTLATLFLMAMVAPALSPRAHAQAPGSATSRPAPAAAPAKPAPRALHAVTPVDTGPTLVDINSADAKALDALPGVGAARAKAIIAGRPYSDKQDLVTRKIIPASVFAGIDTMIALVNINTATAADMARLLPNVGPVRAVAVVKNRPYTTPQDMVTKGALSQGVYDGIKSLVTAK